VLADHCINRLTHERRTPGEHLVHDATEGVEVRAAVRDGLARHRFGADVGRRPQRDTFSGELVARGRVHRFGDAEVSHHCLVVLQQDVLGLDVAVDHAPRVRVGQGTPHLACDPESVIQRQRSVALDSVLERLPLDVRHDVEPQASCHARVI